MQTLQIQTIQGLLDIPLTVPVVVALKVRCVAPAPAVYPHIPDTPPPTTCGHQLQIVNHYTS